MANAFLQLGTRRGSVKDFLKDASGQNSIKYKAERAASHQIYFPYVVEQDENGKETRQLIALSARVHDWIDLDGHYHATLCTAGHIIPNENGGDPIVDGTCPFCDRVSDSWDIYKYRYKMEEETCGKTGEELKKHMEAVKTQYARERKTAEPKDFMYVLVAQFKMQNRKPILDSDGVPMYDLKIMKLSSSALNKIQTQLDSNGVEFEDAEIVFTYPDEADIRLMAGQRSVSVVFPSNKITANNSALLTKILDDAAKFDFDGIEKAYPEWSMMPSATAQKAVSQMFTAWDKYKAEQEELDRLGGGGTAKYLEYAPKGKPVTNPSLAGNPNVGTSAGIPQMGAMPTMGAMPQMGAMPTMGAMPQMGTGMTGNGEADI